MVASENRHVEVVDKLLQHGARVDLQKEVCFDAQLLFSPLSTLRTSSVYILLDDCL